MERTYQAMYRLGLTPWERGHVPPTLMGLAQSLPAGLAVDLGCGTGRDAAYLAENGWEVVGVDVSAAAIARARGRDDRVDWRVANIARDADVLADVAGRASLVVDVGCLHGLDDTGRRAWARTVIAVTAPHAAVLLWCAPPGRRPVGPRGITQAEVIELLDGRFAPIGAAVPASGWFVLSRTASGHGP